MEQVKEKVTFKKFLEALFGNNHFDEDLTKDLQASQLYDTMINVDKEAEASNTPIHSEGKKSSNGGGFSKETIITIHPKALEKKLEKMREYNNNVKGEHDNEHDNEHEI